MSDIGYVRTEMLPEQVPPSLYFLWSVLSGVLPWIWNGSWTAGSLKECREVIAAAAGEHAGEHGHGAACWAVIRERYLQLIYGFYPSELYWRPNLAFIGMLVALAPVLFNSLPRKMLWFSVAFPFIAFWLLWGGSIFLPIGIMVGFFLGYAWMEVLGRNFGSIVGTIGAILVPILWWMLAVGPVETALSGMTANARMDTAPAKLEGLSKL